MIKYLVTLVSILVVLAFTFDAQAGEQEPAKKEVYFGALSYHMDTDKDLNNINPLVIGSYDDWVAGYFYNSYRHNSFMVGRNVYIPKREGSPIVLGVILGAVTGYEKNQVPMCFSDSVCPLFMPYIQWDYGEWKPTIIIGGAFVSATIGYEF